MPSIQEVISQSIDLMQNGCPVEENISKFTANKDDIRLYLKACIYYNYQFYDKCLENLIQLYDLFSKVDHNLFMYAFSQLVTQSKEIDECLFCKICKIHCEIKDFYSIEQIQILNKSLLYYLDTLNNVPDCIMTFLGDIISPVIVKIITSQPESKDLLNHVLSARIDFENIKGKTVYNCYYNESSSGIGDFLRGCCCLFDLLNKTETNYGISFAKHDISPYLKSNSNPTFKKEDIFDTEKINKELCMQDNYIENTKRNIVNVLQETTEKNIFLFTNYSDFIDRKSKIDRVILTKDCQEFMQNNLIFSKSIENESNKLLSDIAENYVIMHFRLGDRNIIESNCFNDNNINTKEYNVKLQESEIGDLNLKKGVTLFTNMNFDTYVLGRNSLFSSMENWLIETIEFWKDNTKDIPLYIRVHPGETKMATPAVKFTREIVKPFLDKNIILIDSDSKINSYSLVLNSNYVITYSSTIGVEAMMMDVPCVSAGEAFYKPFAITTETKQQYFQALEELNNNKRQVKIQKNELESYLHYLYFTRISHFKGFDINRQKAKIELADLDTYKVLVNNNKNILDKFYADCITNE